MIRFFGLILFVIFLNLIQLGLQIRDKITIFSSLDFSWTSDSIERLLHGFIQGKDFIFTYGPLFQLIYSWPSLIFKIPAYSSVALSPITISLISTLIVIIISKIIFEDKNQQFLLSIFLLFFVGLISSPDIKMLIPILFSLILIKLELKHFSPLSMLLIPTLPTFFGLFSYDLFVYCSLILIIFLIFSFIINFKNFKKNYILFIIPVLSVGIIHILFSLIFTHNLQYILFSLDTIKNYEYLMNTPFQIFARANFLFIFTIGLIPVYYFFLKDKPDKKTKLISVLLLVASIIELKTAFIRSDEGHIIRAIYPSLITFYIILYFLIKKRKKFIAVAIIFFIFIPNKPTYNLFALKGINYIYKTISENYSFFDIYKFPKDYYYSKKDFKFFSTLVPNNPVFVFPYDNYILNIQNSTFNYFPLQFYPYSNSRTENEAVKRLKKTPPKYVILGVDTKGVIALDDIPNLTRNPILFRWLINNYQVFKKTNTYLVLIYNPNKQTLTKNDCSLYSLNANLNTENSLTMKILQFIIKPPIYYVKTSKIFSRIPYVGKADSYLFFDEYTNPNKIEELFRYKIDFSKYREDKKMEKEVKIIKKIPFINRDTPVDSKKINVKIYCYY